MAGPTVMLHEKCGVEGRSQKVKDADAPTYVYLGIPYAEPPVGKHRFQPTKPVTLWDGVREAKRFGPSCPQERAINKVTFPRSCDLQELSEDCLHLNVYTPRAPPSDYNHGSTDALLPVMVWIHGGGLFFGSSCTYDGSVLAQHQNVVVVTFNYRLNIFGFLATPDGHIPGNMGLFDQVEALRWVQRYISRFGGDPQNVTIFGESAGGNSVSFHQISPMTRGLFRRAICQSGTSLCRNSTTSDSHNAMKLKDKFAPYGVDVSNGKQLELFLNGMTSDEITEKFFAKYIPVVDHTYIHSYPLDLCSSDEIPSVDLLCGFNTDDGHLLTDIYEYIKVPFIRHCTTKEASEPFIRAILQNIMMYPESKIEEMTQIVTDSYLSDCPDDNTNSISKRTDDVIRDSFFAAPTILHANCNSKSQNGKNTFVYELCHRPVFSKLPPGGQANHTDDIPYVFGEPFMSATDDSWPESDVNLSRMMMAYWANFARTGDPNGADLPRWPRYSSSDRTRLLLQEKPSVTHVDPKGVDIWNVILPELQ